MGILVTNVTSDRHQASHLNLIDYMLTKI
jgi:hypothetical protein